MARASFTDGGSTAAVAFVYMVSEIRSALVPQQDSQWIQKYGILGLFSTLDTNQASRKAGLVTRKDDTEETKLLARRVGCRKNERE